MLGSNHTKSWFLTLGNRCDMGFRGMQTCHPAMPKVTYQPTPRSLRNAISISLSKMYSEVYWGMSRGHSSSGDCRGFRVRGLCHAVCAALEHVACCTFFARLLTCHANVNMGASKGLDTTSMCPGDLRRTGDHPCRLQTTPGLAREAHESLWKLHVLGI